jgi:hypothetical protein
MNDDDPELLAFSFVASPPRTQLRDALHVVIMGALMLVASALWLAMYIDWGSTEQPYVRFVGYAAVVAGACTTLAGMAMVSRARRDRPQLPVA